MSQPHIVGEGRQRLEADCCLALQHRLGRVGAADQPRITESVRRLSRAPLSYFAAQCLSMAGITPPEFASPEEIMELAFGMDGSDQFRVSASSYAYNRPGSFPNLLANLANKVLDAALEMADPTYEEWTGELQDVPDFKPAPIVNKGRHDEMDEILDGEASKEFGLDEEMLAYMVLKRFSNFFELTPLMAANDDLGAFEEGLLGLESAWQNTVNRGCVRMLTGNPTLLDGFNLFDSANHGNDIAGGSGGAPSDAQLDAMNLQVAAQTGIGGKGYIRTPLAVAVVPPAHWRQATQAFAMYQVIGESKLATSDSNINVYRGRVTVVREPELQASSNAIWYAFAKPQGPRNASIVRAYFRGYGKAGKRQRWYDHRTKCWNFEMEGRIGIAVKQYRLAVRNAGA